MGKGLLKCIQIVSEIYYKENNVKVIYIYLIEKYSFNGLSLVMASELLISIANLYYAHGGKELAMYLLFCHHQNNVIFQLKYICIQHCILGNDKTTVDKMYYAYIVFL